MSTLFLLFSHTLTNEQISDARQSLHVQGFAAIPKELQDRWSAIPPDLESIETYLQPIFEWLREEAQSGDYVLVQGDFGAVYLMIRFALEHGLIPVYATTRRDVREVPLSEGRVQVQRTFQHVRYRRYEVKGKG